MKMGGGGGGILIVTIYKARDTSADHLNLK